MKKFVLLVALFSVKAFAFTTCAQSPVCSTSDGVLLDNQRASRFFELSSNGNDYIGLRAPSALSAAYTLTLPTSDGSANQVIQTNGSGALSWGNNSPDLWTLVGSDIYYDDGKVGIGTTAPGYLLDVQEDTEETQAHFGNATSALGGAFIGSIAPNSALYTAGANYSTALGGWIAHATEAEIVDMSGGVMNFTANVGLTPETGFSPTAPNFTIDGTTNHVGIGTGAPIYHLSVESGDTVGTIFELSNGSTGGQGWTIRSLGSDDPNVGGLSFFDSDQRLLINNVGGVVIADPGANGGNVPHSCTTRTASVGTTTSSCSAGEIATGGGVDCGSTALFLSKSVPTGGPPATGWQGSCTSLLNIVTNATILVSALCCQY